MPAQAYRIREHRRRHGSSRYLRETGGTFWSDADRLERLQLKTRIEKWIQQQTDPVLYRQGRRLDQLKQVHFSLDCILRSLVLNCRIPGSNLRARVLQASQDDFGTVVLQAEVRGRIEIFEIRPALETLLSRPLQETRSDFQKTVENLIRKYFPKVADSQIGCFRRSGTFSVREVRPPAVSSRQTPAGLRSPPALKKTRPPSMAC